MITAGGTELYKVHKIYKYIRGDTINFCKFLLISKSVHIATDLEIFNS